MENPFKKIFNKENIRKIAVGTMATGLSIGAMANTSEKNNDVGKIGDPVDGKPKIELSTATKVAKGKVPADHKFYTVKDGKKYYIKKSVQELPQAKPGSSGKLDVKYHDWLIEKLQSGSATVEDLVAKGYISKDKKSTYEKYEKVSLVYEEDETAPVVKEDPYARFAKNEGYSFYNSRVIGTFRYAVMKTASVEDAGMKDTGYEDVLFQPTDENLKPIGEPVIIDGKTWNLINNTTGGKYFDKTSKEKLDLILAEARKINTTASFPGADMAVGNGGLTTNK